MVTDIDALTFKHDDHSRLDQQQKQALLFWLKKAKLKSN
jgi:hypothetical protein